MTRFYEICHNTAYKRGMPEIEEIVSGLLDAGPCPKCGVGRRMLTGDLGVTLGRTRARLWPDAIACGDYPCFVVSGRFVIAMTQCGLALAIGGRVDFVGSNQSGISLEDAPHYFWIDGTRCVAGKMDFCRSGYVDVRFCPECGVRNHNISQTYDRQHSNPPPGHVFSFDESLGLDLFTTDLGPAVFFCTEQVLACARKHGLTNLAFRPVEDGAMAAPVRM